MVDQSECGMGRPREIGPEMIPEGFAAIAFDRGNARAQALKSASYLASRPRKRTYDIGC